MYRAPNRKCCCVCTLHEASVALGVALQHCVGDTGASVFSFSTGVTVEKSYVSRT